MRIERVFAGLLLLGLAPAARAECEVKTIEDPFEAGSIKSVITKVNKAVSLEFQRVQGAAETVEWRVLLLMTAWTSLSQTIPAGSLLEFGYSGAEKMSFVVAHDAPAQGSVYATQYTAGVTTTWLVDATATPEQAAAFAGSRPLALQVLIDGERFISFPDPNTKPGPKAKVEAKFAEFAASVRCLSP